MVLGTHIFDLSVGGGWLELKEDNVEDRHGWTIRCRQCLVIACITCKVSSPAFDICISLVPYCGLRLVVLTQLVTSRERAVFR